MAKQDVEFIVVHCTGTPEGRHVTVEEVTDWHIKRGWRTIGYHALVYLDGSRHMGRPINDDGHLELWERGAHVKGMNARSIGICYVGGVDADGNPKDTRTPAQRAALYALIERYRHQFPGAKVVGHNRFSAKACPSFDVEADWKAYQDSFNMPLPADERKRPLFATSTGQTGLRGLIGTGTALVGVATANAPDVIEAATSGPVRDVMSAVSWGATAIAILAAIGVALLLLKKRREEDKKGKSNV